VILASHDLIEHGSVFAVLQEEQASNTSADRFELVDIYIDAEGAVDGVIERLKSVHGDTGRLTLCELRDSVPWSASSLMDGQAAWSVDRMGILRFWTRREALREASVTFTVQYRDVL
jgi:hypothetical protein